MTDGCFGRIVRSLRLRNIDNCTRHATNHDNAARSLALHQVFRDGSGEKVGAIHVHTPKLLHSFEGVADGVEVLSESRRCNKLIDFAVLREDFCNGVVHGIRARYVGKVCGNLWQPEKR